MSLKWYWTVPWWGLVLVYSQNSRQKKREIGMRSAKYCANGKDRAAAPVVIILRPSRVGVATGNWAAATCWAGPVGESSSREVVGPGLVGSDGLEPGVAGVIMAGSGRSGVDPWGGVTETCIYETGYVRAGPGANTGARASRVGGVFTATKSGVWAYIDSGVGKNGVARA